PRKAGLLARWRDAPSSTKHVDSWAPDTDGSGHLDLPGFLSPISAAELAGYLPVSTCCKEAGAVRSIHPEPPNPRAELRGRDGAHGQSAPHGSARFGVVYHG